MSDTYFPVYCPKPIFAVGTAEEGYIMKHISFIISILIIFSVCVIAISLHNRNSHEDFSTYSYDVKQGIEKSMRGEYEAAIANFDLAIMQDLDDAAAYFFRGEMKHKIGKHFAAISDFDTVIRLKPGYANAYLSRAQAYSSLSQHSAAIVDCNTVIHLQPKNAVAYAYRGLVKSQIRAYRYSDDAIVRDYDTAIRIDPDYAFAYFHRGIQKASAGMYIAAISDFDNVIRLNPMNNAKIYIGAYLCRGMAKQELVEKNNVFTVNPEARQDWETALFFAKLSDNMELQTNIESTLHKYNILIK